MASNEATSRQRGIADQIPRNALGLLMAAQFMVAAPHAANLSLWLMAVVLCCGLWRIQVYRGRFGFPSRWVKGLLVCGAVTAVVLSGHGAFSLESAASLLVLAFALKLIEMRSRRDAYIVMFLAYFVIATAFLFDQSLPLALFELLALLLVTAAMVGMNQLHSRVRPLATLRISGLLLAQALPLTVILFLFFPRVAPLWSVPLPGGGYTGLSDSMTPGDIAELSQSDEVAFRVVFDGDVPVQRALYWRGLVFTDFEQGTWSVPERDGGSVSGSDLAGDPVTYEVLLEPTGSRWLFALDVARPDNRNDVQPGPDYRLLARDPVLSVFRYRVDSFLQASLSAGGDDNWRQRDLALDPQDNPKIQAYGRTLAVQVGSVAGFAAAVAREIRNGPYVYTLKPPRLPPEHSIDRFWFETRRGFCTHYAGALVMMARAAGIPARMVGGYQGGAVNPITRHLVVRQYDAHAWVELWDPAAGWLRVDPTAAVAPQRIESGLEAALSVEDRQALSPFMAARLQPGELVGRFLNWVDSVEHRWNLWVVGFDEGRQQSVLRDLLGELTPARIGFAMLLGGMLSLGVVALLLFWRRRPVQRHPIEALFLDFCAQAAAAGVERAPAESPRVFLRRLARECALDPVQVESLIERIEAFLYNPDVRWQAADRTALRSELRRLRLRTVAAAR